MLSDRSPVFRKIIIPWYHSRTAYILVIIVMLLVLAFGILGITIAGEKSEYLDYVWIPLLLVFLSGIIILTTIIRLLRRYTSK